MGSPTKNALFVWTATHERILTIDDLIRRQKFFGNGELVSHLLRYSVVRVIWTLIYTSFGMVWVLHEELVVVKVGVAAGLEDRK